MKYLFVIILGLSVSGCVVAPYDPYYGYYAPAPAYYPPPAYYAPPAVVSFGYGYGGGYHNRYRRY